MSSEEVNTAATGGPFPYPGGKASLAPWILDHLADHETYVEPFGGAASVLFAKGPSPVEVYNDADEDVVQFFQVLRDRRDELVEYLTAVPYSRALYRDWSRQYFQAGDRPDDDVERAGRWFALRYFTFGGKVGNDGFAAFAGRNKPAALKNQTDRLREFADRLRDVVVECGDYYAVLDRYDSAETLFYLDPPYAGGSEYYPSSGVDLGDVRERAAAVDGDVALSLGRRPDDLGDTWYVTERGYDYAIGSTGGNKETTEVLLTTYDPATERLFSPQEGLGRWSE